MRTIDLTLHTAQPKLGNRYIAGLQIDGVDWSPRLIGYTYRERALQGAYTDIWLDNTDGALNTGPPALRAPVDLERGCLIGSSPHLAGLPRVWIHTLTYQRDAVLLKCVDFWGKLHTYTVTEPLSWESETVQTLVDGLLAEVGLTRQEAITPLTIPFQVPQNVPGDAILKALIEKVPDFPYAGLYGAVKFKPLVATEPVCYNYGFNAYHPVLSASYTVGLAQFNTIHVTGGPDGQGGTYTGTAADQAQITIVGPRPLFVTDSALRSDAACAQRAARELAYQLAFSNQLHLRSLPNHALELFDRIALATSPWGGPPYTAHVGAYTETFRPGRLWQELSPASYANQDVTKLLYAHTTQPEPFLP